MKGLTNYLSGQLLFTMNKGFISIYLCLLLSTVLMVSASIKQSVVRYHKYQIELQEFREMNLVEVLLINRIKQDFYLNETKDENLKYGNCFIEIRYSGYVCEIKIYSDRFERDRKIWWDPIDEMICDYR